MKVAVIGAGSTYTPELIEGIGRLGLDIEELALMDPATDRLQVIAGLGRRILTRLGSTCRVTTTSEVATAASGAAAVLLQLRVGGQAARARDESWPLQCGCIGQETTGAGGLAKAMRTVPVVREIAETVRRVSPGAWIVNFTNPVGIVSRALLDDGHRAIGLCNVAIGLQRLIAGLLEVDPGSVELQHVGLNHLSWETGVTVAGREVLPRLLSEFGEQLVADVELPVELLRREGVIPSYYLRYFYEHDALVRAAAHSPSRAIAVAAIERELLELYADPALDEKPELLAQRGGAYYSEAAVALLRSLIAGEPARHVVNTRNDGTLPFLPDDAVIEVSAMVDEDGAVPVEVGEVPPLALGLIAHTAAYEVLALDAARNGGRDRVSRALLAHPLVGQLETADALTELLLTENAAWLGPAR
ncbi:MAG TPA: 6-phospho-beta-glucosidase [Pseudolysinimonas sp.]|nr:6-phospho-beta-glucosidase [Pseudolysinimonas sp.]